MKISKDVRIKQITDTTLDIIMKKGVSGLTLSEVAKGVGFSEAALFRYYTSKSDLLSEAMTHISKCLIDGIYLILQKNINPVQKLKELIEFHIGFIENNKSLPRVIFSDELHINNAELRTTIMELHKKFINAVSIILKECIEQNVFKNDLDPNMAAKTVFGLIQTTIFTASLTDFKVDFSEQGTRIFEFLQNIFAK